MVIGGPAPIKDCLVDYVLIVRRTIIRLASPIVQHVFGYASNSILATGHTVTRSVFELA